MANLQTFRKGIVPKASNAHVNHLLWVCSPYPLAKDVRKLRRSLRQCLRQGGGSIEGAIDYAHQELDRAFEEYRAQKAEVLPGLAAKDA